LTRSARYRLGIDVGGTFTDAWIIDETTGRVRVAKQSTTANPIDGILRLLEEQGVHPSEMSLLLHGTTVATNALLTRSFPRTAMVTTAGFRDVIEIRRGTKENIWDAYEDVAPPPIARRDRFEVRERIDAAGNVLVELFLEDAERVARTIAARGIDTVAVCFVNSYTNGANERRMGELLLAELPEAHVSLSSEVLPQIFEHERFSTTVVNALLSPVVGTYVGALGDALSERGFRGDVLLLHSGGGVMTPRSARRFAARLAASGLAAGAIACREVAVRAGFEDALGLDMGGTSADVTVVRHGELGSRDEWSVEFGYPICFPSVDVLTIGAGGGSIASVDAGGSLRCGPESAGSTPGPACYALGGTRPTVTDANLVLGRLGESLAGGSVPLDVTLARDAVREHVAEPLQMSIEEAAQAVIAVSVAKMADAVRVMSVRRGHDPRDFVLVCFGGAGPLHAAALLDELEIDVALVPPHPGLMSAFGCLLVDIRHDVSQMWFANVSDVAEADLARAFAELEREVADRLAADGVEPAEMEVGRFIELRYEGQWRSLALRMEDGGLSGAVERFHGEHERIHNYRRDDARVEVVKLATTGIGLTRRPTFAADPARDGGDTRVGQRLVVFDDASAPVETPVFDHALLPPAFELSGPAVVEGLDSTVLIPPWFTAAIDESGTLQLSRDGRST
jgi:N-methylhydantoinase A